MGAPLVECKRGWISLVDVLGRIEHDRNLVGSDLQPLMRSNAERLLVDVEDIRLDLVDEPSERLRLHVRVTVDVSFAADGELDDAKHFPGKRPLIAVSRPISRDDERDIDLVRLERALAGPVSYVATAVVDAEHPHAGELIQRRPG
jgi:hypothetical protein